MHTLACVFHHGILQVWWQRKVVNTISPEPNSCNFADKIFEIYFLEKNCCPSIIISLKSVPQVKGPTEYKLALVQVMAWHRRGNKLLPEPIMTMATKSQVFVQYGFIIW